jgi:hypothetical protein
VAITVSAVQHRDPHFQANASEHLHRFFGQFSLPGTSCIEVDQAQSASATFQNEDQVLHYVTVRAKGNRVVLATINGEVADSPDGEAWSQARQILDTLSLEVDH